MFCFDQTLLAQQYRYDFELRDCKASKAILGYYKGDVMFQLDSTSVDTTKGTFAFSGNKYLESGEYFVSVPSLGVLFFIINNENNFRVKGRVTSAQDSLIAEGSSENKIYFEFKKFVSVQNEKLQNIRNMMDMLKRATKDAEVLKEQEDAMKSIYESIASKAREIVIKNPELLFSKMLSATQNVAIPIGMEAFVGNKPNPVYNQFVKNHYWDGVDFKDERLLNTTAYRAVLSRYFERGVEPDIDSIKVGIERIVEKSKNNKAFYQYTIQFLSRKFDNPKLPWMDNILVYLFDRHYKSAASVGVDTATFLRMEYKASAYRPNQIGALAPNLILYDTLGKATQLSSIQSDFLLLYFFSPLCAHCQKATPIFADLIRKYPSSRLKIISISNDGEMDYWTSFVKAQQYPFACYHDKLKPSKSEQLYATSDLPNVYLLDKNKKILAKKIPLENMESLLKSFVDKK
jgi:peroxiredoxin